MRRPKQDAERWLRQAEHDIVVAQRDLPTRYPDALADPAVPFESYTREQATQALHVAQGILEAVKRKVSG